MRDDLGIASATGAVSEAGLGCGLIVAVLFVLAVALALAEKFSPQPPTYVPSRKEIVPSFKGVIEEVDCKQRTLFISSRFGRHEALVFDDKRNILKHSDGRNFDWTPYGADNDKLWKVLGRNRVVVYIMIPGPHEVVLFE